MASYPGLLLATAIGDAYGAGFEFAVPSFVQTHNTVTQYYPHPKGTILAGHYTDDTQMCLGVASVMLSNQPWTYTLLAQSFVDVFKRDPRSGYAQNFHNFLQKIPDGEAFLSALTPHSAKCGGAMRATPCGLLSSVQKVINFAMWQASLTHATKEGMDAAAGAALLVWLCRRGTLQEFLPAFLSLYIPGYPWDTPWEGFVSSEGIAVVRAALTVLQEANTYQEVLRRSVAYTGDVDSVASIAMAAASMHPRISCDLPQNFFDQLENDLYGKDYLEVLDQLLLTQYPLSMTES